MIAVACVTAGATLNVARDGGEPPREGTRAGDSPYPSPVSTDATTRPARTLPSLQLRASAPVSAPTHASTRIDDPEAAARVAETQTDPELRKLAIREVAQRWGAEDAERAVNWARSLADATERDAALIDIANGLSSVDPARGVELREQFVAATQPDNALNNLVQQWAGYNFDDALAWTNARAPGAQRDELLQRLIYVRAASGDPAAAARLVSESTLTGKAKSAALASINQEWKQRDDAAAQEWMRTVEPASPN